MTPPRVVMVGVAGSGKTTVGQALAAALSVPFVDADAFHPPANRERMANGLPLDDGMRAPWLAAVHAHLAAEVAGGRGFVLACSALRQRYRDTLAAGLPPLRWVHLAADVATLGARLAARADHFFPASLLPSQLATFEPLVAGEVVDASLPVPAIVAHLLAAR
jgi:carbohydrate kinase (thermoresistant glucokinase family)